MAEQLNNVLFYDKDNAKYKLPDTSDTFRLNMDSTIGGDMTITGATTLSGILSLTGAATMSSNLTVDGNLVVKGSTETVHSETVLIQDNYLDLNHGYSADAAQQGGLTVNYDPTTTKTTSASFTAGAGSDSPKVTVASSSGFAANDIIQISDATDNGNDGLYIILSISSNDLNVYGVTGTSVPAAHTWAKNQFTTNASDTAATVCKVNISVMKVDSSGDWQVGKGANISSISYAAIQTGTDGTPTLDQVYDSGNEITTDSSGGNVLISGDQKLQVTATGGVQVSGGVLDVDSSADFDVSGFTVDVSGAGFSIDGAGASNVSTSSGALNLSAAGNASLTSSGGTVSINDAAGSIEMASGAVSTTGVASFALTPSGAFDVTAGAASAISVGSANLDLKTTTSGDVNVNAAGNLDLDGATVNCDSAGVMEFQGGGNSFFRTSSGTMQLQGQGDTTLLSNGGDAYVTSSSGTVSISGGAAATVTDGTATQTMASGALSYSGVTTASIPASSTFDIDAGGAMTLDAASFTVGGDGDTGAIAMTATSAAMTLTAAGINLAGGSSEVDITTSGALDVNVGSVDLDSTAGVAIDATTMSLDGTDDSNFTVTGSGKDLTLSVAGGGTQKLILDSAGTGAQAIRLNSSAGGIDMDSAGILSANATGADLKLKTTTSGNIEVEAAGYVYNKSFIAVNGDNPHTDNGSGIGTRMVAGEAISQGHMTYIANGGLFKANANSAASAFVLGVAPAAISSGQWGNVRSVQGTFCRPVFKSGDGPTQASDVGARVYLSTTDGEVCLTPPTDSGDIQFQVGSIIYWDSSNPNTHSQIVLQPQYLAEVP